MYFKIDRKIRNVRDGVYTGVVVAYGLDNRTPNEQIAEGLKCEIEKVKREDDREEMKNSELLAPYREAMEELGISSGKYPCSIEAILNRIKKKGDFPSISPIVDLGNYISLKYKVPVGVHDLDTLEGELCVRCADREDCQREENSLDHDKLREGEPVYATGNSVRTRRFMWRQLPAGRITEKSQNIIFPIDGFTHNRETIEAACKELQQCVEVFFHVEAEAGYVNADNPEYRFGQMSEEEAELENQIAIMLKGAAQHTDVSEIREKIRAAKREHRPLRVK